MKIIPVVSQVLFLVISILAFANRAKSQEISIKDSLQKATLLYQKQDYQSSYQVLYSLIENDIEDPVALHYMGLIMLDLNKSDLARTFLQYSIRLDSSLAENYSELAYLYVNKPDYDSAILYAKTALNWNPDLTKAYFNLSTAYIGKNEIEKSRSAIYTAALRDPDNAARLAGQFFVSNGNPDDAIYFFNLIYLADSANILNSANYGSAYKMKGDLNKAIEVMKYAVASGDINTEQYPLLYSSYFRALLDTKNYQRILDEASSRVDEGFIDQYLYTSLAYFRRNNKAEFKEVATHYFQKSGKPLPDSLDDWASAYFK